MEDFKSIEKNFIQITEKVGSLRCLKPNPESNKHLSNLVSFIVGCGWCSTEKLVTDPAITSRFPELRTICGRAEMELEKFWAKRIIESRSPWEELRSFPYFSNYERLVRLESHLLRGVGIENISNVVFVGSGSLPLTAILQHHNEGTRFTLIDRDQEACTLAEQLLHKLGVGESFSIQNCSIEDSDIYSRFQIVQVAAMVEGAHLPSLFHSLAKQMSPSQLLTVRSVKGLRCALYRPLLAEDLRDFDIEIEAHPHNDIVNSIIIGRSKPLSRKSPTPTGTA